MFLRVFELRNTLFGIGRIHAWERREENHERCEKDETWLKGAGFLFFGGDGFGGDVVEVVGVVGADEGREGYLLVGDFGGEGEGDFLGSFPGRGDHFSLKAFCFWCRL